ncbi:MAG: glycoside hydrolase family 5 protein [Lachnospiraceae bacterium]|nr:glycoside hydrolase family 5 protein [Lachnospiraceae bacterium]
MCKKSFRKKIVLTLAALILASFIGGCTNGSVSQSTETTETIESTSGSDKTKNQESSAQSSSDETSTSESKVEEKKEPFVSDRSAAFELLSHITIGWNLGNTLDAHGAGASLLSETRWRNPKTTQEMMDAVAAQGFNAVRIPVTFAEHVGKAPYYTIDDAWLNRVQEVVDYALNAGMYVLLDTHHEPDYWLKPDEAHEEASIAELTAIWTQVAERFRNYDEKLIFEGMNEPRIKGSSAEWNGGTAQERKVVDHLNQAFIDAVRSTGGNNETRLLVICTYGNNPGYNIIKEFTIPEDNYIAVAVHMYTPYYFTFDGEGGQFYDTWDGSEKSSISSTMKQIDKYFIKNDLPVIVTEFGAVNKGKSEEVIKWATDYLSVMNSYGVKCFWWDNNIYNTSGEKFGIFNRRELSWFDQELADALVSNATAED